MRKGRKYCVFFILISLLILGDTYASDVGKIDLLSDREYFPEVMRLIGDAGSSVNVIMFEAGYYEEHPGSPSNQLIESVANAGRRGLRAEVVLERQKDKSRTTRRNLETAKILKQSGVEVTLDPESVTTHAKLIIIDGSIVVLGSTNWTYSGLTQNHETNCVIHSKEVARKLLDYFRKIKVSGKNF